MKNIYTILFICFSAFSTSNGLKAQELHAVEMGAAYANEVFYSFNTGVVKTSPRGIWDIAFHTSAFSAGIIINEGNGVELYAYPNASNEGWNTFDTTDKASWKRLYNQVANWETGAFNYHATGHPDYGWSVYNVNNHDLVGDSLFLIKLADGTYLKLDIIKKLSTQNQYEIRFAEVNGANEQLVTLSVGDHTSKVFMAYSFTNGVVDREPDANLWDLVFMRYHAFIDGLYYPVIGVLRNPATEIAEARLVEPGFNDWSSLDYETGADVIGHDWKTFDMQTFEYIIEDSLYYFVKAQNGNIYKLTFDDFTVPFGITTFYTEMISALSVNDDVFNTTLLYPNPATSSLKMQLPFGEKSTVIFNNLMGEEIAHYQFDNGTSQTIDLSTFINGTYLVTVISGKHSKTFKIVVLR